MTPVQAEQLIAQRRDVTRGNECKVYPEQVRVCNELLRLGYVRYELRGPGPIRYAVILITEDGMAALAVWETQERLERSMKQKATVEPPEHLKMYSGKWTP